jgi:hypothetical protein
MNPLAQRTMFGLYEEPADPATCKHPVEIETFTNWPGVEGERMTWTCELCGNIRGRATAGVPAKPRKYVFGGLADGKETR